MPSGDQSASHETGTKDLAAEPEDLKLGTLLTYFGVVSDQDIKRGLVLSKHTGLPLGKCLVMLDFCTNEVVRAAIEAQSMIKDSLLDAEAAKEAMGVVHRKRWTLSDALIVLGVDAYATRGTRLGELLLSAEHVNPLQVDIALKASDGSGLPLGRVLVLLSKLSEPSLDLALNLQRDVRFGRIDRSLAVEQLRKEKLHIPVEGRDGDKDDKRVRIGELLIASHLLSAAEVQSAVEMAKANDKMMGEVLIEMGWVSQDLLTAALRLQEMVWSGGVSVYRASSALKHIDKSGLTAEEGLEKAGLKPSEFQKQVSFCDFLRLSGYLNKDSMKEIVQMVMGNPELIAAVMKHARKEGNVSKDYLREAIKLSFKNTELLGFLLRHSRPDDRALIDSATIMHELLKSGKLTLDQAVVNFTIRQNGLEFEQ